MKPKSFLRHGNTQKARTSSVYAVCRLAGIGLGSHFPRFPCASVAKIDVHAKRRLVFFELQRAYQRPQQGFGQLHEQRVGQRLLMAEGQQVGRVVALRAAA